MISINLENTGKKDETLTVVIRFTRSVLWNVSLKKNAEIYRMTSDRNSKCSKKTCTSIDMFFSYSS
jgi:hypothetical protein